MQARDALVLYLLASLHHVIARKRCTSFMRRRARSPRHSCRSVSAPSPLQVDDHPERTRSLSLRAAYQSKHGAAQSPRQRLLAAVPVPIGALSLLHLNALSTLSTLASRRP